IGGGGRLVAETGRHYAQMSIQLADKVGLLDVLNPFLPDFREMVLTMMDGVYLLNAAGEKVPEAFVLIPVEEIEPEDQGMRAFNYRSEPFENRAREPVPQNIYDVFSSRVHGDPATPVVLAHVGDPLTFQLMVPADLSRAHGFTLDGHLLRKVSQDILSQVICASNADTIGEGAPTVFLYGAGPSGKPGDYLFHGTLIRWDVELGMWGILRVLPAGAPGILPLPDRTG
ncbi:MAG: copper oxidase, partial [Firmicutes bacterium]|nr:copper oxidase [Bacillota bacterium]